ncbi:DUF134 domain-containing protein [Sunxiuqinia elliptica]|uniref:Predicted DNA-binding protein, UPF0251 family n=1 Tax=Sunxiuqinia elliptica TaxID=655355 RepID=A0A1I2J9C8_9BACT|nr:DUF134 domain-containing protein [Sunxiuqinia elliptica]TDN98896.1 putative DNA-binding protein (UPF0251 family) [Sunxiuqinia elliptica]TDO56337.1 putative DNA-binding protein (UPF0251 family) [Sunxiuqinia elliptica]SFF51432.1 Predicted DNA-binding protein, UPF0251 family [Sunxiuqinia elliptica]
MPRKKRQRRLLAPPSVKGFSVFGPKNRAEQVVLFFEEYEAIKLLDYDNLTQEEAAVCMEVSRPTLTRIYESARNKVAQAMVEGKDLLIRGGNFQFDENWYCCSDCKARFNMAAEDKDCPVCNSSEIVSLNAFFQASSTN